MRENSTGIKTHRDHFVIDFDHRMLENRISEFRDLQIDDATIRQKYELTDTYDWILSEQRKILSKDSSWKKYFQDCLYRPFDIRQIYYNVEMIDRARPEIMRHLLEENLALLTMRRIRTPSYDHFLATKWIIGKDVVSLEDACYIFPIYLYTTPEETAGTLFAQTETTRKANLSLAFISAFSEKLGLTFIQDGSGDLKKTFGPEDVFYYAYAVFHSPTYRTRYAEFLKIDFPRLQLTSDKKLFAKLVGKGKELVELHLLKSSKVDDFITTWLEAGDNKVEKVAYASGKVHINARQYFGKLPEEVWEFKVGGYQVCEKWLKDRKGRVLSSEDITHYQRVVVALKETIRLMKEIDKLILKWPME
jgi:predicted helicase